MTLEEYNFFFKISGQIEKDLWEKAIFVFDTSSILEIYYYSEQTRQQICFNLFSALKDKLWITSHTNYEYLKNRESVIKRSFSEKYSKLRKEQLASIKKDITSLENNITDVKQKTKNEDIHPFISQHIFDSFFKSIESIKSEFETFQNKFEDEVNKREGELKKLENDDDVYKTIDKCFKITDDYEYIKIEKIINDSIIRFQNMIPPGFKDAQGKNEKQGIQKFGDLIIWNQIIELAIKLNTPIIFITNDGKEDWWDIEKEGREKSRPKEDLILEFKLKTGKQFWAYSFSQFLHKAKEILNVNIAAKTIEEIQKISDLLQSVSTEAFEYWKDENNFYLFSLNLANGLPIIHSNAYLTKNSCLNTIEAIRRYAIIDESYEKIVRTNGDYFFRIKGLNGETIVQSIMCSNEFERNICIETCKKIAPIAPIIEVNR